MCSATALHIVQKEVDPTFQGDATPERLTHKTFSSLNPFSSRSQLFNCL